MALYRVGFYNDIPDSTGHDHHVCQREVEVSCDGGCDQAIAEAIRDFEQQEHISHWNLHARKIEWVRIDPDQ
jgi:hypothetical protein